MDTFDFDDSPVSIGNNPESGSQAEYIRLVKGNLVPLRVVAPCLVWVLHDYFVTVEDEVRYVWSQKRSFGKYLFFFIRYYTILLLIFDVVQIHTFARKGVTNASLCTAFDALIRIVGGISLWAVEIYMQVRIYALYGRSKKVAWFNGVLFLISIVMFVGILAWTVHERQKFIAPVMKYPLPGCPTVNGGLRWAQWLPATLFEINLFGFILHKAITSPTVCVKLNKRLPLIAVLLQDNTLYFFGVTFVLIMNNVMTINSGVIPWFGFAPFHAALGIMTGRMYIHLRKVAVGIAEQADLATIETGGRVAVLPGMLNFEEALRDLEDGTDSDGGSVLSDVTDHEPMVGPSMDGEGGFSGDIESRNCGVGRAYVLPGSASDWASSSSSSSSSSHAIQQEMTSIHSRPVWSTSAVPSSLITSHFSRTSGASSSSSLPRTLPAHLESSTSVTNDLENPQW